MKKVWRKKIRYVDKEIPEVNGLPISTVLNIKISEVENTFLVLVV